MTYKDLIKIFYVFAAQHPILQNWSWGNLSDYQREDYIQKYPAIHFVPQPSTIDNTYTNFNFTILIFDLLNEYVGVETKSNQLDSLSLTYEILNDFYAFFINQLTGYGTEVRLEKIYKHYEDGRLDIKTRCLSAFQIQSFDNPMLGKLYAGGEINYLGNDPKISAALHHEFIFYLKEILYLLDFITEYDPNLVNSFTFAHKIGLKLEDELELLKIESEEERSQFLIQHFKRMIPVMKAIEQAKEKIKQNGHFKHLDPLSF
jgi:hypothetical protein